MAFFGHIRGKWSVIALAAAVSGCAMRGEPLGAAHSAQFAAQIQGDISSDTSPVSRPLDVYDAMARALVHNQELKAEQMARMLGDAELALSSAGMLPQFVASSQVYGRNNSPASTSRLISASRPSNIYSVSSEQVSRSAELAFSWSILDFGVSYFRARQAAHKSLIAAEQQRRTANRIIEETRIAFYRARALQTLDQGLQRLDAEMNLSIANAAKLSASGLTDPLDALTAERDLLSVRRELDQQRKALVGAEEQLRALINYPADVPLRLADAPRHEVPGLQRMRFADVAAITLANRPEVKQAAYEQQINAEEARIAFLELFPNINLILGASLDQNPFLLHQGWTSVASRASWQLVKILQYPMKSAVLDGQADLTRQRTRALAVAVILQGQVSLSRLNQAQQEYRTLGKLAAVQRQLAIQIEHQRQVGRSGTQAATRERMNALLAEARRDAAYGEVQGAYAGVLTSFGHDLADSTLAAGQPVDRLAAELRAGEATVFTRAPHALSASASTPTSTPTRLVAR